VVAEIHQLILRDGVAETKATALNKIERQCIDAASKLLADEEQKVGITHAGFAMTALPHKAIPDLLWARQGPNIRLLVESGRGLTGKPVGLPYGAIARLILFYLQSEAVKTRSLEIELGRSMYHWLKAMGIDSGGANYKAVREQSLRLALCRLTFYRSGEGATLISNGSFVRDVLIPDHEDVWQPRLWRDTVKLDEQFYKSLIEHPLPLREAAIREIAHRSMAIDIYVWLAYRLHVLAEATPITWKALHAQFGAGFSQVKHFKPKFQEPFRLAMAVYPEAKVDIDEQGLILYPSPAPVPEHRAQGVVRLSRLKR
jgi:hypothetical protein